MINVTDIHTLAELKGKIVEFTSKIEDWECYADNYMRARVIGYKFNPHGDTIPSEQVHEIFFDFSEFDEHNRKYEQNNYWDKDGNATLTAREAGYYHPQDSIWFGNELPFLVVE